MIRIKPNLLTVCRFCLGLNLIFVFALAWGQDRYSSQCPDGVSGPFLEDKIIGDVSNVLKEIESARSLLPLQELENFEDVTLTSVEDLQSARQTNMGRVPEIVQMEFQKLEEKEWEGLLREYEKDLQYDDHFIASAQERLKQLESKVLVKTIGSSEKLSKNQAQLRRKILAIDNQLEWVKVSREFHHAKWNHLKQLISQRMQRHEEDLAVLTAEVQSLQEEEKRNKSKALEEKRKARVEIRKTMKRARKDLTPEDTIEGLIGEVGHKQKKIDELESELTAIKMKQRNDKGQYLKARQRRNLHPLRLQIMENKHREIQLTLEKEQLQKRIERDKMKRSIDVVRQTLDSMLPASKMTRQNDKIQAHVPPHVPPQDPPLKQEEVEEEVASKGPMSETPVRVGLHNGGNYCYMNSTLKLLASFPLIDQALRRPLVKRNAEIDEQFERRKNLQRVLGELLADLRANKELAQKEKKAQRDRIFQALLDNGWLANTANKYEQADAGELMMFLLGKLDYNGNALTLEKERWIGEERPIVAGDIHLERTKIEGIFPLELPPVGTTMGQLLRELQAQEVMDVPYYDESPKFRIQKDGETRVISTNDYVTMKALDRDRIFLEKNVVSLTTGKIEYLRRLEDGKVERIAPDELEAYPQHLKEKVIILEKMRPHLVTSGGVTKEEELTGSDLLEIRGRKDVRVQEKTVRQIRQASFSGEAPEEILFQLNRFNADGSKNNVEVGLDETITIPFKRGDVIERVRYRLVGIIDHHGRSKGSGHYTAHIWSQGQNGQIGWHVHNDNLPVSYDHDRSKKASNTSYQVLYKKVKL